MEEGQGGALGTSPPPASDLSLLLLALGLQTPQLGKQISKTYPSWLLGSSPGVWERASSRPPARLEESVRRPVQEARTLER
jgi:hypothetical protein